MRTKYGVDTNSTENKRKPAVNNLHTKGGSSNRGISNDDITKYKTSAKTKNNFRYSKPSVSGKPSCSSVKTEENHTTDTKKFRRKSDVPYKKPISINSTPVNRKSRKPNNERGNVPNKRKQNKIVDPYDNPILNTMYKICIEIDRRDNNKLPDLSKC